MKTIFFLVLFVLLSSFSYAQSMQSARSEYISYCESEGDDYGLCACTFDSWAQTIPADSASQSAAVSMIRMITESSEPSRNEMQKIQPYIASFSQAGMSCAFGGGAGADVISDLSEEGSYTDQIPNAAGGGFADALGGLMSGDMSALMEMSEQQESERETEREQRVEERRMQEQIIQEDRDRLNREYNAEIKNIERGSIINRSLNSYKSVHTLYCQAQNRFNDGYEEFCDCSWGQLNEVVGADRETASLTAYMSSISEGDNQWEPGVTNEMLSKARSQISQFYDKRNTSCSRN